MQDPEEWSDDDEQGPTALGIKLSEFCNNYRRPKRLKEKDDWATNYNLNPPLPDTRKGQYRNTTPSAAHLTPWQPPPGPPPEPERSAGIDRTDPLEYLERGSMATLLLPTLHSRVHPSNEFAPPAVYDPPKEDDTSHEKPPPAPPKKNKKQPSVKPRRTHQQQKEQINSEQESANPCRIDPPRRGPILPEALVPKKINFMSEEVTSMEANYHGQKDKMYNVTPSLSEQQQTKKQKDAGREATRCRFGDQAPSGPNIQENTGPPDWAKRLPPKLVLLAQN